MVEGSYDCDDSFVLVQKKKKLTQGLTDKCVCVNGQAYFYRA